MFKSIITIAIIFLSSCSQPKENYDPSTDLLRFKGEVHLRNIKQLTFGGNNAEAYWSFDDKQLVFQSDWDKLNDHGCDQIFLMNVDGSQLVQNETYRLISTGKGRTTCSYFLKDGRIIFASTHAQSEECPEQVMFTGGRYVWPIYKSYDIYITDSTASTTELFIGGEGYDAEPTASPDGKYIVFTSTRSGDLELWRYEIETAALLQLTNTLGYDGGAFFSRDSRSIVWRASRPVGEEANEYKALLSEGLVEPKAMSIYIADIEGNNVRKVTELPGANWAPFFHTSGNKIIFSSNHHSIGEGGRLFDLFLINLDGTGLEQITHSGTFDAFPMFSFDGSKIVFASNRRVDRSSSRETNIFVADWVENPTDEDNNF
ncbi:MAG: hypothetical protein KKA84_01480 [Bacteroidetes bacterium]|nr:hypothetical protein [Bacteroidota bacterium]